MIGSKPTILVVEDDELISKVLIDRLEMEGFFVIFAEDGEEGLELALDRKPDIILLDIIMPKMDGLSMFKNLRLDKWGKKVPIIMLTNLSENDELHDIISKDKKLDYLVKIDYTLEEIVERVKIFLNLHQPKKHKD